LSTTFQVIGDTYVSEVILSYDKIKFETKSRLIMKPDKEMPKAPRTLTIITNSIEITDTAVITYDLDNITGIDPETPPSPQTSTGAHGSDGANQSGVGAYPHAKDGGHGMPGQRGNDGTDGIDAPTLEIWVGDVSAGSMTINFKGQDGGRGGHGGNGGNGGNGQKGAKSKMEDAWYNGEECTQEPGRGGNGGRGGDAGWPGSGGDGGDGGNVKVFTKQASEALVNNWDIKVKGGDGGNLGNPGNPGLGGQGGPQGDKVSPCPKRTEFAGNPGPQGQNMSEINPNWQTDLKGRDGEDGESRVYRIQIMPH